MELSKEQIIARANRLQKLVRNDGWSDFLDMISEQEETIISKLITSNHYERDEIVGQLKHNRYIATMVGRAIEDGINK